MLQGQNNQEIKDKSGGPPDLARFQTTSGKEYHHNNHAVLQDRENSHLKC